MTSLIMETSNMKSLKYQNKIKIRDNYVCSKHLEMLYIGHCIRQKQCQKTLYIIFAMHDEGFIKKD